MFDVGWDPADFQFVEPEYERVPLRCSVYVGSLVSEDNWREGQPCGVIGAAHFYTYLNDFDQRIRYPIPLCHLHSRSMLREPHELPTVSVWTKDFHHRKVRVFAKDSAWSDPDALARYDNFDDALARYGLTREDQVSFEWE